jgi:hypothetical protein
MRNPNGLRAESNRSPNASRAGALQRQRQSQHQRQNYGPSGPIHRYGLYGAPLATMNGGYAAGVGGGR